MLGFRDYQLAMTIIEQLDMKQYTSMVYDDWCQALIRHSTCSESELQKKLEEKLMKLRIRNAEELGIDV